jgi:hypothetical protein
VPREFAGKWIAWDQAMTHIVACGDTPADVLESAKAIGIFDPILDKLPRASVLMIGGPRRIERRTTSTATTDP